MAKYSDCSCQPFHRPKAFLRPSTSGLRIPKSFFCHQKFFDILRIFSHFLNKFYSFRFYILFFAYATIQSHLIYFLGHKLKIHQCTL